jgi:hypothetical protein
LRLFVDSAVRQLFTKRKGAVDSNSEQRTRND